MLNMVWAHVRSSHLTFLSCRSGASFTLYHVPSAMVQITLAHVHRSRGPFYNISDHSDILKLMHEGKVVPDYGSPCALFLDKDFVSRPS